MIRFRPGLRKPVSTLVRHVGCAAALLGVMLWAPNAYAYPMYDDGTGVGCVQCHTGFLGGNGPLHRQHRDNFGVTSCNLCHPSGAGSTPVYTFWSGAGGGLGCAGCHGQDYGETSVTAPHIGQPKATAYGLRQFHVAQGKTECGTSGCHAPGALGHPNPFPTLFGENVAPPYYNATYSNLTDPCSSTQEDLPFDLDAVGLDNDGDGAADYPADSDCAAPPTPTPTPSLAPTATPTPTVPFNCGAAPASGCIAPAKALLLVNEKTAGKEKLKVTLKKLQTTVTQSQFGSPVNLGGTAYKVCVYATGQLRGEYTVARAGETCSDQPCWSAKSDKGYKYKDKSTTADGILKINLSGGDAGKGTVVVVGKNNASPPTMPTGIAAALQNQTSATVQVLTSDASCFGVSLTSVKKADGSIFKAVMP